MIKLKSNSSDIARYINKEGKRINDEIISRIIKDSRDLSVKMQNDMNVAIDQGPVSFTQRSVAFLYSRYSAGCSTTILIKDIQAKYLYEILVKPKAIDKIVPTSAARLDRFGNIAGLRRNLSNGRYKVVKQGTKERLIDTKGKKEKRVIGLREDKRRKMVYDFYRNGEKGALLIIKDIKGTFKIKKA